MADYTRLYLSNGNKKLRGNEVIGFMIWNLPSVITCPYRTAMCEFSCYAKKSETAYPTVLPRRMANLNLSKQPGFAQDMAEMILSKASRGKNKYRKIIVVRIHESGDFYNRAYFEKWLEVARIVGAADKRIVFMAYTKSVSYVEGAGIPSNMFIRFSLWDDTRETERKKAEALGLPIYTADTETAVNDAVKTGAATKCDCTDCGACRKCWDASEKCIEVVIH